MSIGLFCRAICKKKVAQKIQNTDKHENAVQKTPNAVFFLHSCSI